MKKIYYHPWFPRLFYKKTDGGPKSGVYGYFLIEWKKVFSIGLLHFKEGSRENYHSHAFNACTWWLKGKVTEITWLSFTHRRPERTYKPSWIAKITKRDKVHKVIAHKDTWSLTFRGPWHDTWYEVNPSGEKIKLTHNRKVVK